MEGNSIRKSHNKSSRTTRRVTGKRKYFINRARAGKSLDSVENEQEEECEISAEELEHLGVEGHREILQLLKINIPEGSLNAHVSERSTRSDVITDGKAIVRDLRNGKLTIVPKPRLSCVKVKQAYRLKESGEITAFTKMLFFKKHKEETLKTRWEKNAPQTGCRFRMRDTFNESPISSPETPLGSTGAGGTAWLGNPAQNRSDELDCFRFFLELNGLDPEDVKYRREYTVESGFISGRMDFLLDIPDSAESDETSLREKIIIECKGTKGDMVGNVFTLPQDEGHQVELNKSHEYYHQTQAYLSILKKEGDPLPVRAVMVVKHTTEDTDPKFYWGEVSDDMGSIDTLNHFCQEEVLPRFLAVLNLIFQKNE